MDKKTFGAIGEELAAQYLKKKKYQILDRNFSNKLGEIDIIAKQNDVIIFIEVKSRSSSKFGLPREAVTVYKRNKIRRIALVYLKQKRMLNSPCRFDVIEDFNGEIRHIENCF